MILIFFMILAPVDGTQVFHLYQITQHMVKDCNIPLNLHSACVCSVFHS